MFSEAFEAIADLGKKLIGATQPCPLAKGIICVVISRADTNGAIEGVSVSVAGPSAGNTSANDVGIAQFDDRDPGDYEITVEFPGNLRHYNYSDNKSVDKAWQGGVSLRGGQVRVVEVLAHPCGNIKPKIMVLQTDGSKVPLPAKEVRAVNIKGPHSAKQEKNNNPTFQRVNCGEYKVEVDFDQETYELENTKPIVANVAENATAEPEILVVAKTWVEVEIIDETNEKPLSKVTADIRKPDSSLVTSKSGEGGKVKVTYRLQKGKASIDQLSIDGDDVYVVTAVEEA